jgi:hypothetical protein
MTSYANSRSNQTVTADTVQQEIKAANQCHNTSKGKAAEAAAHAYCVWRDAFASTATKFTKDWMRDQIVERNKAIDAHNDTLRKTKSKEPRQVRVDMRAGASPFTEVVKYVFDFREAAQATLVSRYAKVLEWIDDHFKNQVISAVTDITDAIEAANGFEAVINVKRGATPKPPANDDDELAARVIEEIKTAAASNVHVQSFSITVEEADKFVISLGRYKSGAVEVVSTVPLPDEDAESVLRLFEADLGPKMSESAAFVTRVIDLADLVAEGRPSAHKEDDISVGKALKEERVLTLASEGSALQLGVSARYAEACVVITAQPSAPNVKLGAPDAPVAMTKDDYSKLAETLGNKATRCLLDLTVAATPTGQSDLRWAVSNTAKPGSDKAYAWESIAAQDHKPLEVDRFSASFTVDIAKTSLVQLYIERLKVWQAKEKAKKADEFASASKKAEKAKKVITIRFAGSELGYSMEGDADLALPLAGSIASPLAMSFRPRDLFALLSKLKEQKASTFQLSGDAGGMLRVSWSDDLGTYCIYQPTVNKRGELEAKRLAPMQSVTVPLAA